MEERDRLNQDYAGLTQEELLAKDEEFAQNDTMSLDDIEFQEDEEMDHYSVSGEKEKEGSDASFHESEDEEDGAESDEEDIEDDDSDFLLDGKVDALDDKSESEELNSEALSLSAKTSSKPLNLGRKAPARYKKQGYDPVEDGHVINISHCVIELDNFIGENRKRESRKWISSDQEFSDEDKASIIKILNSSSAFSGLKEIDEIHPIESDAFPSFCGKDATYVNRHVFKYIRNSMILGYITDPYAELTVTECYRHLRYDIHDLATIHNFLSHYHLINSKVC